ncbi:MAG: exosortase C-terminal domain/associated protein EpsI [Thermodesulfobacteriota bacterium]
MKHFAIAAFLLAATIVYTGFLRTVQAVAPLQPLATFPLVIGEFRSSGDQRFGDEVVGVLGVDHYVWREYRDGNGYPLWLYVGFYESQAEGEIIHSPKHCMPGGGWNPLKSQVVPIDTAAGNKIGISQMFLQKGLDKQLAHYWYQGRGRVVADEYVDRAYMVLDSLTSRRTDEALIRITGPGNDYETDVAKQLAFAKALLPVLDQFLPGKEL